MKYFRKQSGFSLMELLIVVAIIGLLASFILASFQSARAKSRDARRMSDMRNIGNALNLLASDQYGIYPTTSGAVTITGSDIVSTQLEAGGHLSETPLDPLPSVYTYEYNSTSGSGYALTFCLETDGYNNLGFQQGCGNAVQQ